MASKLQLLFVTAVVLCAGCVESLFYYPSTAPFQTPDDQEDVYFVTADGKRLHGLFAAAPGAQAGPAVLVLHGNAGNVSRRVEMIRALADAGFSALVFDYRGYGRSDPPGERYTRELLLADAEAALAYLHTRSEVDDDRIAVIGTSLGVVFATALGVRHRDLRAVVAISGFSTWQGMAHDIVPVLGGALIPAGLDPAVSASRLHAPLLILHGAADQLVSVEHAHRIYDFARGHDVDVRLHILRGIPHSSPFEGEKQHVVEAFLHHHLSSALAD